MKYLNHLLALIFVLLLASCGGGGGCDGAPIGSTATGCNSSAASAAPTPVGTTVTASAITLYFTNSTSTFAPLAQNNVSSNPSTYAVANVLDSAGAALANQIVSFSTDNTVATLSSALALTDASGRAWVRIQPASLTANGAAILNATSTMAGTTVTASQGYQVGASNVALGTMTFSVSNPTALASSKVTVPVTVNGVTATAGQVNVTIQAGCGYFTTPGTNQTTVATDSSGFASATWTSQGTCGGLPVSFSATAAGVTSPSTGQVTVQAVTVANILYVGATASTLVVSSSAGTKQSTLTFKVVDQTGTGVNTSPGVTFTMDNASLTAGVTLSSLTGTADANGNVTVAVNSGSLPTPVTVTASLTATASMKANSIGLVVSSGNPTQDYTSLSATKLNILGRTVDGAPTTINLRTSDRMGNPPPLNTIVTFSTGYGSVSGFCNTDASGGCSVTYISGGSRPTSGIVTILATLAGEESFIDTNGNNVYDVGIDTFTDLGQPYRDDNQNGTYDAAAEQKYGTANGSAACTSGTALSVTNTCNGLWDSSTLVRQQIRIGLSGDVATASMSMVTAGTTYDVTVRDGATGSLVGMPNGTSLSAIVTAGTPPGTCAIVGNIAPAAVPNQVGPSVHRITLNNSGCTGTNTTVTVTVTAPGGNQSVTTFGPL